MRQERFFFFCKKELKNGKEIARGRISELRTAESPPRAPPFWPPLKSEWRVWGRRLNMEKVLVVQKIGR